VGFMNVVYVLWIVDVLFLFREQKAISRRDILGGIVGVV
jgi:hypothetical protein